MKTTNKIAQSVWEYFLIAAGSAIYAVGFIIFLLPHHIPLGGVVGVSMIFNQLLSTPVGVMTIVINIPLMAYGLKMLGKRFFFKTAWAILASSLMIDFLTPMLPSYNGDLLLSTLYGGIALGVGFGIILWAGGTSGGTDIIAKFFNIKWSVNIGTTNLIANGVVIAANAIVNQNMESALYAIIATYLTGVVIDQIVYGGDLQKNAFIITSNPKDVSHAIIESLHHGVTSIDATGMYTGAHKNVLMTVVRRHETQTLKKIISQADPTAFIIMTEASEVYGQGFKQHEGH